MSLWPCLSSLEMESRSAPVSNEVKRPETSTSETKPAWRILIEKFASVTVHALSAGGIILPAEQGNGRKNYEKEVVCGEGCWFNDTDCCAANSIGASRCGVRAANVRIRTEN